MVTSILSQLPAVTFKNIWVLSHQQYLWKPPKHSLSLLPKSLDKGHIVIGHCQHVSSPILSTLIWFRSLWNSARISCKCMSFVKARKRILHDCAEKSSPWSYMWNMLMWITLTGSHAKKYRRRYTQVDLKKTQGGSKETQKMIAESS